MEENNLVDKAILKKQAKATLDEPVIIDIEFKPKTLKERVLCFLKIKKRQHQYKITGATLRTMIKISDLLLDINYSQMPEKTIDQLPWAYECILHNAELSVKIIAIAIHNHNSPYPAGLVDLILDNCESRDHQKIAFNIIDKLDVFTFTTTITSIRKISLLEEVSQQVTGELIAPTEEIVIPGEQLAALSNIFASATKR